MRWIFAVGSVCLVLNACVEFTTMPERVRFRAANELNCDPEKVEVESLGSNRYHAKGCGQGGTFVCSGDLAASWHPTKNAPAMPKLVTARSYKTVWWRCRRDASHEWRSAPVATTGCPCCAGKRLAAEERALTG
jgi:hypothetical protein